jgi:hypothetical protein
MNTSDNPPRCARHLFTLTQEADHDLQMVSKTMKTSLSQTIRDALRLYVERLKESGRAPMTEEALRLGGVLVDVTDESGNPLSSFDAGENDSANQPNNRFDNPWNNADGDAGCPDDEEALG